MIMKKYIVYLWCGSGYLLTPFPVDGDNAEQALEKVSAVLISENLKQYFSEQDEHEEFCKNYLNIDDEFEDEGAIYVDGTIEGADRPIWINAENLKIQEVINN